MSVFQIFQLNLTSDHHETVNEGEEKKRPEIRKGNIMDVQIEKVSATKTSVALKWWARHNEDEIKPYHEWVLSKLKKALKLP